MFNTHHYCPTVSLLCSNRYITLESKQTKSCHKDQLGLNKNLTYINKPSEFHALRSAKNKENKTNKKKEEHPPQTCLGYMTEASYISDPEHSRKDNSITSKTYLIQSYSLPIKE